MVVMKLVRRGEVFGDWFRGSGDEGLLVVTLFAKKEWDEEWDKMGLSRLYE